MKRGLVLEGGAMRGLFSAGAMDVMMEYGVHFDGIVGVSAGACFGCNYKSRQHGRAIRYNKQFAGDGRYCGFGSLIKTGNYYNAEFAYHIVPTQYDVFDADAYAANPMEYYVVCTDITTGKAVYKKCERFDHEMLEWIRASASMPVVSTVVEVGGLKLLDGGVSDSIPLRFFQQQGYTDNVVILTQPIDYVKRPLKAMPLVKWSLRKYPEMVAAMQNRHVMYNEQTAYVRSEEAQGRCIVIRPEAPINIGHFSINADEMQRIYELGREAALKKIDEIIKG
ncbi:MAG: patatin family protein [Prevotella sp.]|nr:patatin family protein [Prevotella sp.]